MDDHNQQRLERQPVRKFHQVRYDALLAILFRYDPMRICGLGNPHRETEYISEVNTILPRLDVQLSVEQIHDIVYEEFTRWFGLSVGPRERYGVVATAIWMVLHEGR